GEAFTIAEVMNDLASTPFARNGMCCETVSGKSLEGIDNLVVSGCVLCDEAFSFFGCHFIVPLCLGSCAESIMRDRMRSKGIMPQTGREHFGLEQRADSPVLFARNPSGASDPVVLAL